MNTENIILVFKDYLMSDTNQALLINGKWGSGKTFFWKTTLQDSIDKNQFKVIYISLNGISKIENLEHILFLKLIPFLNNQENKAIKNITKLGTNILDRLSSHYLKTGLKEIFRDLSIDGFNFKNYIICFDDLERCQIPIKEVFGFINNFVEHKNLKTIFLADQTEIDEEKENGKDYKNIKEKLIGRELNYELDLENTLPKIFEKFKKDEEFSSFLVNNQKYIFDLFREFKIQNLRTISFYLEILKKTYPLFKNENEKRKIEIILFCAIISIQFKNGELKSSEYINAFDYEDVHQFHFSSDLFKKLKIDSKEKKEVKEEPKTNRQVIFEKFLQNRVNDYSFFNSLFRYILTGYFDENLFENELKEKDEKENNTPERQAFTKLINYDFRSLSNYDFEFFLKEILIYLKNGKYTIYEYQHISNFLHFFSENNLTSLNKDEIEKILITGLNKSAENRMIDERTFDNMMHWESKSAEDEKIKNLIKSAHNQIENEQMQNEISEFVDKISSNQIEYVEDKFKWSFFSQLFRFISHKKLFAIIKSSENRNIRQLQSLFLQSFKYYTLENYTLENLDFINNLKNSLVKYVEDCKVSNVRIFLIKEFIEELENIRIQISKKFSL